MKRPSNVGTFKGRFLGISVLVFVQLIVGFIHVIYGFAMLSGNFSVATYSMLPMVYTVYTLAYGLSTLFFAYLIWTGKRSGWIGTVAVSLFVIIVDILAVVGLPNILGIPIPKVAAIGEIPFSVLVLMYLLQHHVRSKYNI